MSSNTTGPIIQVKNHLIKLLQDYYGEKEPTYEFKWTNDIRTTKIVIADKYAINLGSIGQMPAIRANLGPKNLSSKTLGQNTDIDYRTTTTKYLVLYESTVIFQCVCVLGAQSERLAHETWEVFLYYGWDWMQMIPYIHHVTNIAIGEEQLIDADSNTKRIGIPVQVSVVMQHAWSYTKEGPLLKEIEILPPESPEEHQEPSEGDEGSE